MNWPRRSAICPSLWTSSGDDPDGIDEGKLNDIKAALDKATAVVDEIENDQPRRG
jgi:hypothetical protein